MVKSLKLMPTFFLAFFIILALSFSQTGLQPANGAPLMVGGTYQSPQPEQHSLGAEILGGKVVETVVPTGETAITSSNSLDTSIIFNSGSVSGLATLDEVQSSIEINLTAKKASFSITYTGDSTNLSTNLNTRLTSIFTNSSNLNFLVKTYGYSYTGIPGNILIKFTATYWPVVLNPIVSANQTELAQDIEDLLMGSSNGTIRYTGDDISDWNGSLQTIIQEILNRDGNDYRHFSMKGWSFSYRPGRVTGTQITTAFTYWETPEQAAFVDSQVDKILADIIQAGMSDEEKEKAINDYIVLYTTYDKTLKEHSAYASLAKGTTVCQGYALLAYKMLTEAGIPARIIDGNAGGPHAWNLVQLGGNWYHLDCTWNDPLPDTKGRVGYSYFNLSDSEIASTRTWTNASFPAATTHYTTADADINNHSRMVDIDSISLNKETTTLVVGKNETLTPVIDPEKIYKKMIWLSSNPAVATVDSNGTITAKAIGAATIKATTDIGSLSDSCQVLVKPVLVMGIELNKDTTQLKIGEFETLTATLTTDATEKKITWTTSNAKVASVDTTGKVKGVSVGTATITATSLDGKFTDTCTVTVNPVLVESITLNASSDSLPIGQSKTLIATITPTNATNKTINWTSNHPDIASVTNGLVKCLAVGEATVTATTIDGSKIASYVITVIPKTVVSLDKTSISIEKGDSAALTATIQEGATSITCVSSNTGIITVAMSGTDITVSAPTNSLGGTAKVTLSAKVGTKAYTAICTVAVPTRVVSISLDCATASLPVSGTKVLKATLNPTTATVKTINWTSSDGTTVSVDSKGSIKGLKAGTATITATSTDGNKEASCDVTVGNVAATKITVTPITAILKVGANKTLAGVITPANATDKTIGWASSDEAIATVDSLGKVTAIATGTATITASQGSLSAVCSITVTAGSSVTAVKLNKTALTLNTGLSEKLSPIFTPVAPANSGVSWSSSAEEIATVDENGLVTAVAAGTADITVTTDDGNKTAICKVTIVSKVTGVSLDQDIIEQLAPGDTVTLVATIAPAGASNNKVTWLSSKAAVATVSTTGLVTGKTPGTTVITVTTLDGKFTDSCRVVVLPVLTTGISLNKSTTTLAVKGYETLTVNFTPANATNQKVTWISSAPTVVSVANGKITGLKAGSATITATSADGYYKATCTVTV
ncbi:MAG: hypothetical protein CVU90_13305 [Firmicutes bacterium HGW-Firmicutes-15]|nr:MAG: hypothetical protein CVU90_13305 [Firmicutes bacterium HGW-Firmicutes-15]